MGPPHEGLIRRPIAPWANALTTELHLAPEEGRVSGVKDNQAVFLFSYMAADIWFWDILYLPFQTG